MKQDYHRPGLLSIDGRDVRGISTWWLARNYLGNQEAINAILETFETPISFTQAEFVQWLSELGKEGWKDCFESIQVLFFGDNRGICVSDMVREKA